MYVVTVSQHPAFIASLLTGSEKPFPRNLEDSTKMIQAQAFCKLQMQCLVLTCMRGCLYEIMFISKYKILHMLLSYFKENVASYSVEYFLLTTLFRRKRQNRYPEKSVVK